MIQVSKIDPGLCCDCAHAQVVTSDRGSIFYRCALAATDPRFLKYPKLPVLCCDGWRKLQVAAESLFPLNGFE